MTTAAEMRAIQKKAKREQAKRAAKFERLLGQMERMQSSYTRLSDQVEILRKVWDVVKYGRICANPKCFESADPWYCSEQCANAVRQQRYRDKRKALRK
jgi:hypothetical protein